MRFSENAVAELLVRVEQLSVTYLPDSDQPIRALDSVSLEIRPGERIGILGESGSGKSTLAAAILRLLPGDARYDSGTIRFRDQDVLTLSESALRQIRGAAIALIPQEPALALNPVIRAGDQISEVLRAHLPMSRRDRKARIEELLTEVGFDQPQSIYTAYPHQLSGGQRQRIVIAQAIACKPQLVIADEATSKLDASLQAEVIDLMLQISRRYGMAFVVISHDPTVLAGFADRIVVMQAGRILEEGCTTDIFRRPVHPYTKGLVRLSARHLSNTGIRTRFETVASEVAHS